MPSGAAGASNHASTLPTDFLICECFNFKQTMKKHLDYQTLLNNRHLLETRRIVLTHMGDDMLKHLNSTTIESA